MTCLFMIILGGDFLSRICPLFSSSSGNCTYIGTQQGGILVDAGASFKGICEALLRAGGSIDEITAVFITHEHDDHIKGLKTLLNKTNIALFASETTLETLRGFDKIPAKTKLFSMDDNKIEIGGIIVERFATSHDCDGSSGYSFVLPDKKRVAVCTDSGIVTDSMRKSLKGNDLVLLESNHDIEMLKRGPYPPHLKMRILSDKGHLSNNACACELNALVGTGTTRVILGHLSQHNNTPMLAKATAEAALMVNGAQNGRDYILSVARPQNNGVTVI